MRLPKTCLAVSLAFLPLFLTPPAFGWDATNAQVNENTVQFSYTWGFAESNVTDGVTVTIDNTITNKIGWNGEVIDTFRVTFNDQTIEMTEKGVFTFTFEGAGLLRVEGVDNGFWGGYYGPIATLSTPIIEPIPVEPEPEPTPEPTPSPEPAPEPVEPQPSPTPEPEPLPLPEPEPVVIPEPAPAPNPEPEPQPTPEPTLPFDPDPVVPPVVEPEPTPEPEAPKPEPKPSPSSPAIPTEEPNAPTEPAPETPTIPETPEPEPLPETEEISIAIIGQAVEQLVSAVTSAGLDMSPEEREEAQEVVVSTIIVSQVASAASVAVRKIK